MHSGTLKTLSTLKSLEEAIQCTWAISVCLVAQVYPEALLSRVKYTQMSKILVSSFNICNIFEQYFNILNSSQLNVYFTRYWWLQAVSAELWGKSRKQFADLTASCASSFHILGLFFFNPLFYQDSEETDF